MYNFPRNLNLLSELESELKSCLKIAENSEKHVIDYYFFYVLFPFLYLDSSINAVSFVSQIAQNRVIFAIFGTLNFFDFSGVNFKNIQSSIIDAKFDEEFKSLLKIGLQIIAQN